MQYTTPRAECNLPSSCFIRISKILLYAIHNPCLLWRSVLLLFYQDFKDTFVCNTQLRCFLIIGANSCFIRISKILLYAIHNTIVIVIDFLKLFYQDFKDTFVCNTQPALASTAGTASCFIRISKILLYAIHNLPCSAFSHVRVVLSGFQRYFCMQYTTSVFMDILTGSCFIRISMNNLLQKYKKSLKSANL